jgi:hypothetical protein
MLPNTACESCLQGCCCAELTRKKAKRAAKAPMAFRKAMTATGTTTFTSSNDQNASEVHGRSSVRSQKPTTHTLPHGAASKAMQACTWLTTTQQPTGKAPWPPVVRCSWQEAGVRQRQCQLTGY